MVLFDVALAVALILLVALLFSPLGLGGGILFVPILHYLLGWPLEDSIVTSLGLVWMVSMGSRLAHHQQGKESISAAKTAIVLYIPAAIFGVLIGLYLLENVTDMFIKVAASILMVVVLTNTVQRMWQEKVHAGEPPQKIPPGGLKPVRYRMGCWVGGLSAGLLGIGGGAIMVMLGRTYGGMGAHTAAGTSYSVESWGVPVAIIAHLLMGGGIDAILQHVPLVWAVIVPLLVLFIAWSGATWSMQRIPARMISALFIVVIASGLLRYLFDIFTELML